LQREANKLRLFRNVTFIFDGVGAVHRWRHYRGGKSGTRASVIPFSDRTIGWWVYWRIIRFLSW